MSGKRHKKIKLIGKQIIKSCPIWSPKAYYNSDEVRRWSEIITINKIRERVKEAEKGTIFTLTDFLDLANFDAAKKALSRMGKSGELIRILRGIYKSPNYNEFLKSEIPASPDQIARAIAKEQNWTIGPKGDAALNILGLTTQVPAVYEYIFDGPYKKIEYDGIKIQFMKSSNKNISGKTYKDDSDYRSNKDIGAGWE